MSEVAPTSAPSAQGSPPPAPVTAKTPTQDDTSTSQSSGFFSIPSLATTSQRFLDRTWNLLDTVVGARLDGYVDQASEVLESSTVAALRSENEKSSALSSRSGSLSLPGLTPEPVIKIVHAPLTPRTIADLVAPEREEAERRLRSEMEEKLARERELRELAEKSGQDLRVKLEAQAEQERSLRERAERSEAELQQRLALLETLKVDETTSVQSQLDAEKSRRDVLQSANDSALESLRIEQERRANAERERDELTSLLKENDASWQARLDALREESEDAVSRVQGDLRTQVDRQAAERAEHEEHASQTHAQLDALKAHIRSAGEEHAQRIQELEGKIAELNELVSRETAKRKEAEDLAESLRAQLRGEEDAAGEARRIATNELETLRQELASASSELKSSKEVASSLQAQLEDALAARAEKSSEAASSSSHEEAAVELRARILELETQLASAKEQDAVKTLDAERNSGKQVQGLEDQLEELKASLTTSEDARVAAEAKVVELQQHVGELSAKLESVHAALLDLRSDSSLARRQFEDMELELRSKEAKLDESLARIQDMERERAEAQSSGEREEELLRKIEALEEKCATLQEDAARSARSAEAKLKDLETELYRLRSAKEDDSRAEASSSQMEIEDLRRSLSAERDAHRAETKRFASEIAGLEKSKKTSVAELNATKFELNQLLSSISSLVDEKNELMSQLKSSAEENAALREASNKRRDHAAHLEARLAALKDQTDRELDLLEQDNEALREEIRAQGVMLERSAMRADPDVVHLKEQENEALREEIRTQRLTLERVVAASGAAPDGAHSPPRRSTATSEDLARSNALASAIKNVESERKRKFLGKWRSMVAARAMNMENDAEDVD